MELTLERIEQRVGAATWLYPLDLTLVPRAVTVLLGATQAGKTTLMRVMAGLDAPAKGRVLADGNDVTGKPVRERDVAMVYQQFINYPSMTVAGNIASPLKLRGAWTRETSLPGGDLSASIGAPRRPDTDFVRFVQALALRHPTLAPALVHRLARAYGSRVETLLGGDGLGPTVVPGLHEGELRYLHEREWARSADDVLWRRTKLGLHYDAAQRERVAAWCRTHWAAAAGPGVPATEASWS